MSGQYIFSFPPDSMIDPIIIYPGEFNSATVNNRLQIIQTTTDQVITVFGDFTYRFAADYQFDIVGGANAGTYTTIQSQYLPKTAITAINAEAATVSIVGDGSLLFTNNRVFTIQSSTYNTGRWIAKSSSYDGLTTTIELASSANGDPIPPSLKDGATLNSTLLDGFVETGATAIQVAEPIVAEANQGMIEYSVPLSEVGTSITLPGRGAPMPGEYINRNFIDLLSNFASTTPPIKPVSGQMWYDMSRVRVWDSSTDQWGNLGITTISTNRSVEVPPDGTTLMITPPYTIGSGTLSVYRNGMKLFPELDYTEVESGLVSMTKPTNTGEKFLFEVLSLS